MTSTLWSQRTSNTTAGYGVIEELQGKEMANARPEVVQAEDDPLQKFRGDIEGIEDYSNRQICNCLSGFAFAVVNI